jgi:hypothetical protein
LIIAACVIAAAMCACGKKGPPLPPIVHVPGAVTQVSAKRVGGDVVVTLTMPSQNIDKSTPVDLARVDVYGYTARSAPPLARFTEVATLVGTIGREQNPAGAAARLHDTLTAEELVAGPPVATGPGASTASVPEAASRVPLKRFYAAIAYSDRNRAGPPSAIVALPLTPLPDAPLDLRATYDQETATLTWEPSGGLVGFLLDRAPLPSASAVDDGPPTSSEGVLPAGPTRYNVYREIALEPAPPPVPNTAAVLPAPPLNQAPVDGFTYSDPLQIDGRRRCYSVTAVRGTGDAAVESRRSERVCFDVVDTFAPPRPGGLEPVAAEGEISLVWEASTAPDVRGYIVLRGEESIDVLTPITDEAVPEPRFTDRNVRPGVRYVYAVKAIDSRLPVPNQSAESERVEVTAR